MATLETTFAGLKLKNPIIISSSGLTDSAAKNQKLYEAGAGAIVLKSLFEEQIMMEADWLGDPNMYPEGSDYLVGYIREHKLGEYLNLIKETKKVCDIPVIASINCYQDADWIEFARKIEEAGADALEVNILALQTDIQYAYGSFEQRHIDILSHIRKTVNIPVIMKLGDNLTNPIALIDQLYANGAAAVVMFNRFYQPDIDIEKMRHIIETMTHFGFVITGDKGFDYGQVCQGGVALDDIDISNMESKKVKGVFFAGEVVDVDGKCGGYNLQWAWSSAYLAAAGVKERINN